MLGRRRPPAGCTKNPLWSPVSRADIKPQPLQVLTTSYGLDYIMAHAECQIWMPDLPDQRDYKFGVVYKIPVKLPASVDLRAQCSPVEDQGNLGSCTANSLAGALEFLERKDQVAFADLSRLFIYYNERVIEHTVSSDSGAMLRDGIKTLAKQGVCTEALWFHRV
jgi:C1A family cysteine protease